MKKRILLISNMYPSAKYPHYGIFVKNTKRILEQSGNHVDKSVIIKEDGILKRFFGYIKFYAEVIVKCSRDYDAIYAHFASHVALPLLLTSKFKTTPIILNVHGNDVVPEDDHDRRFTGIVKKIVQKSTYIICPSEYYSDIMRNVYHVEPSRLCIYPSGGIDTEFFTDIDRNKARKLLGLEPDKLFIGYASRFEIHKGWDIYLNACADLIMDNPKIRLVVAGGGSEEDRFHSLIKELSLTDKIIKFDLLSHDKLRLFYNAVDVFVFPTYRKSESLGLVGLESMACKTITVLPNKYGPSSYAEDGENCICFESGNTKSLCNAIKKALALDDETAAQMRIKARETAERYDSRNTGKILTDLFEDQI